MVWHIQEGRYADVELDGLNVLALAGFTGNAWTGPVTDSETAIFFDERADEGQREALQKISGGEAGGWPAAFAETVDTIRGVGQCRSPLAFVAQHCHQQLTSGGLSAGKVGARHGLACVGCCWALMLVLALLGMMSLVWMAVVAAVIFSEKVFPAGHRVGVAVGVLLLVGGTTLLISPHAMSMLA